MLVHSQAAGSGAATQIAKHIGAKSLERVCRQAPEFALGVDHLTTPDRDFESARENHAARVSSSSSTVGGHRSKATILAHRSLDFGLVGGRMTGMLG